MERTPSQQTVFDLVQKYDRNNTRLFILWYGGIRAGKTFGAVDGLVEHSIARENTNYIVAGYVLRSIINNVVPYFQTIAKDRKLKIKSIEGGVNPRIELESNRFLFYGGDKHGRGKNIQGATASGLLIDEYELLNRDFVKQCEARISGDNAIRIYTSNKGQPYSWAKKEYYDRITNGEIEGVIVDSNPDENTFISDDYWEEKYSEFEGVYKSRFLDNEFSFDNQGIYPVKFADKILSDYPEVIVIYSYAQHHLTIPFYSEPGGYVIGEVEHREFPINIDGFDNRSILLINSTAPVLGRELTYAKYYVRGYSDMFMPFKAELCQRAFGYGKVRVLDTAKECIEHIESYSVPGLSESPVIAAIESTIEYLARTNRWI